MNQSTCSIDGCEKPVLGRGWCNMHYSRWRRWGSVDHIQKVVRYCTIDGCDKTRVAFGLCSMHHQRKKRGSPNPESPASLRVYASVCKVEGCLRKHFRLGYCSMHSARYRKHGDPGRPGKIRIPGRACSVGDCSEAHHAGGLCSFHYQHKDSDVVRSCARCGDDIDMMERSATGRKRHGSTLMCSTCLRARTSRAKWSAKAIAARSGSGDCALCGRVVDLSLRFPAPLSGSVDHVTPVSRGGSNELDNLQLAHLACNMRKGASVPEGDLENV